MSQTYKSVISFFALNDKFFDNSIYKLLKWWYNEIAKQKTNNDLKENALFL